MTSPPAAARPANPRASLGAFGEDLACQVLTDAGMRILARNWRCRTGEIDIVALDGECLVVCEVKTRAGLGFGSPIEAVTWRKLQRLRSLAALWLRSRESTESGESGDAEARPTYTSVRVDVIGILHNDAQVPRVQHVRGA